MKKKVICFRTGQSSSRYINRRQSFLPKLFFKEFYRRAIHINSEMNHPLGIPNKMSAEPKIIK